jgi:hypothetical protein
MHDAYEEAAQVTGWETQERSRVPWSDVPEANKATMREAVRALLSSVAFGENLAQRDRDIAARAWDGGVDRERERICRIIDANVCKCTEDCTRIDMFGDDLIALIHGERVAHLENLRRLADETGEYHLFGNVRTYQGDDK